MNEPEETVATVDALSRHKRLDATFLRLRFGLRDDARGVIIPYRTANGLLARPRLRERVETAHPTKWLGDAVMNCYVDVQTLEAARRCGILVVVEGESDRWTLEKHGIPALGVPGATMVDLVEREHVEGIRRILVVREPGVAGERFARQVPERLRALRYDGEIYVVDVYAMCGADDPSELYVRDTEAFEAEWQRANEAATPVVQAPIAGSGEPVSPESSGRRSQADLLVKLADDLGVELVHDQAMVSYAIVSQGEVRIVQAIESTAFSSLLAKEFFERYAKAPRAAALSDARRVFVGRALHAGRLAEVALRVAGNDDVIDVDLGDDQWRMVHITPDGWSIMAHGDRLFRRAPGMLALPEPVFGNLAELRNFIRVDDGDHPLVVAFLVNAIRPRGPYPILLLTGEQGSSKTTTARILRRLIDPNKADVRAEPRDNRDLAIAAHNGHVVVLDNLSHLTGQLSNALCRLSTGGGFTTRALFTNDEEIIFEAQRPTIITSIADVASRPDLLERAIQVRLQPISESERRTEAELWAEFNAAHARIFGALLQAISAALRNAPKVEHDTKRKPRMADAYCWAFAAAPAMEIEPDELERAWGRTREEAHATTLESSVIAGPLLKLIGHGAWQGNASELLTCLHGLADDMTLKRREWPKSPKALADQVRQIAPALRASGVDHGESRTAHSRLHQFVPVKSTDSGASRASLPSSGLLGQGKSEDDLASSGRNLRRQVDASVTTRVNFAAAGDAGDEGDDEFLPLFAPEPELEREP